MDKIKILMAASEAIPYMKTGGLADVVGSLPKYFDKDRYDVRVILPKYKCMDDKLLPQLKFVCHFYVNLNWRRQYVGIFTSQYDGVTYYFVDNEFYFAGDKPYNNIYEDVEKFAFFSKAVLEALPVIDFAPDVIHCNDWQTGLLPVFLKTVYGSDNFYAGIKTVFTIHNMKFQGRWKIKEVADVTGLPEHIFNSGELEFYGEANYLKGGIVYADEITTVSPTYADEICTPEGGEGLDGLMLERRRHLRGIVNGIDYDVFNPMKDTYLDKHFSVRELSGKVVNKRQLQEKYGLAVDKDVMLIGIVSRLTKQKGFDLVAYVMEEMLSTMNVHHALNNVFWFDTIGLGDLSHFWAGETSKDVSWSLGMYMSGFFPCMMFGIPGAALAMVKCAKPAKKKAAIGILASAAICAFICGVTEPFEFAFMFLAPGLYVIYALLYGIFTMVTVALGFRAGFSFSAGGMDLLFSSSLPAAARTWLIIPLGIAAFIIFYIVFYFAIKKWNLKTPGREDDDVEAEKKAVLSNNDYTAVAKTILEGCGGKDNIASIDNCITRLRLEVKDITQVDDKKIKSAGVAGVMKPGKNSVQVIIGTKVQFVADEFSKLCE